ncbi:MAG TPA: DoxX family protein [Thermomicrobiales bacterium]|nr:DoxX family protein [Thermomicrobiales bacterium]
MQARLQSVPVSVNAPLVGRIVSGMAALFLAIDGVVKLATPEPVVRAMDELGYPDRMAVGIGALLLACLAVYLYPRTSALGAVLLTGYLGGAIASQVRIEADLFPVVFPAIVGTLIWTGLYLRDARLRALLAPRGE